MLTERERRHLRYFAAVAEALSFTKAAAQLRVAQPSRSRQMQDLEEELGVALLKRSRRGAMLTGEGKLFLEEVLDLLKRADEAVGKVRAAVRGEYGRLHIGYAPAPTAEFLPAALAAFQKVIPHVKILLHDLSSHELTARSPARTMSVLWALPGPRKTRRAPPPRNFAKSCGGIQNPVLAENEGRWHPVGGNRGQYRDTPHPRRRWRWDFTSP